MFAAISTSISTSVAFWDYLVYSCLGHSQCLSCQLSILYNIFCFYFSSSGLYFMTNSSFWGFGSYLLFESHFPACYGPFSHHPRALTWVAQVGNSSCGWTKFPKATRQASTCNESTVTFGHPAFEYCNSSSHQLSSEAWHPAYCQLSSCLSSSCWPYKHGSCWKQQFQENWRNHHVILVRHWMLAGCSSADSHLCIGHHCA